MVVVTGRAGEGCEGRARIDQTDNLRRIVAVQVRKVYRVVDRVVEYRALLIAQKSERRSLAHCHGIAVGLTVLAAARGGPGFAGIHGSFV